MHQCKTIPCASGILAEHVLAESLHLPLLVFKLPLLIWASSDGKLALKIQFQKQAHY